MNFRILAASVRPHGRFFALLAATALSASLIASAAQAQTPAPAPGAPAAVFHLCHIALDGVLIFIKERHVPDPFGAAFGRSHDGLFQAIIIDKQTGSVGPFGWR